MTFTERKEASMTKFELDTIYEDGRIMVAARTDFDWTFIKDGVTNQKAIFIVDGMGFYECEILVQDGRECVKIPGFNKIIKADANAISIPAQRSDIKEWLDIAQENLEYIQHYGGEYEDDESHLKKAIKALRKRLFEKQLDSCPDCGGDMQFKTGGMGFFFKCSKCGHRWRGGVITNSTDEKIEEAIERWNSRKGVA